MNGDKAMGDFLETTQFQGKDGEEVTWDGGEYEGEEEPEDDGESGDRLPPKVGG